MHFFLPVLALLFLSGANAAAMRGSDIISAVTSQQWTDASTNKITVTINDDADYYNFAPRDLSLIVGQAYILRVENNATNTGKHYYTAPGLYASSAIRKIQTEMAEMKADFLGDQELLAVATGSWSEYYFVPMAAGAFPVTCTIGSHAVKGMNGTITVTNDNAVTNTLITDWASDYTVDTKVAPDGRRSGDHAVWTTIMDIDVEIMSPNGANDMTGYAFNPTNLNLTVGQAYRFKIHHTGDGSNDKHYYTAPEFFKSVVTRKLQDANGEFKFPYMNAVELTDTPALSGKVTYMDLYIVPTVVGTFPATCTISGHAAAGMAGTITVSAASPSPSPSPTSSAPVVAGSLVLAFLALF
jgi:uncharacterized cupredoxin-like copper-binding protein